MLKTQETGATKEETIQILGEKSDMKQEAPQRVPGDPGCNVGAQMIEN